MILNNMILNNILENVIRSCHPISVNWTARFKLLNPHKSTAKQSLIKTTYQDNKKYREAQ